MGGSPAGNSPKAAAVNRVDDVSFTRPLVRALRQHVKAAAASMPDLAPDVRWRAAVAWVYTSALVAWAEDHDLVDPFLRVGARQLREAFLGLPGADMRTWLAGSYASLAVHPSTRCLIDPRWTSLHEGMPSEDACRALVAWWSDGAPSLAYECETGPASITGWLVGDLLQALSDTRREGNALCQTPWWIADGIIDRTLIPAAREFRKEEALPAIDPTCGTGHFLIRLVDYQWELYTTGAMASRQMRAPGVSGWTPVGPEEAIRRILTGITGVELDPLTTAVARLRMVVTVAHKMHGAGLLEGPLRLDTIPDTVRPRVMVGDSLLAGKVPPEHYYRLRPEHAAIYGWSAGSVSQAATSPGSEPEQLDLFDLDVRNPA